MSWKNHPEKEEREKQLPERKDQDQKRGKIGENNRKSVPTKREKKIERN